MATTRPYSMPEILDRLGHTIISAASALRRHVATGVKHVQFAQMQSVLNRLSNQQLAQIGVQRSDIPAYARKLIYDGD